MRIRSIRNQRRGFVSYAMVLSTGLVLTMMMVYSYRRSMAAHEVQAKVQLRTDYAEKEDAVLRSIVAITPNRAMRAMQHNSNASTTNSNPLRWQNIFSEAVDLANARTSIATNVRSSLGIANLRSGNSGDSALADPSKIFKALNNETGYVSAGINRSLGTVFPPALATSTANTVSRDPVYPIISGDKLYGTLAQGAVGLSTTTYPKFNLLTYPRINFGYVRPGESFVAKRNWWAFSMNMAGHDATTTKVAAPSRDFVLSIYEIPSQLPISASSFMALGRYSTGEAWQNVSIDGGIFAGKANVDDNTSLPNLSSRRGMTIPSTSTVGGESFANSPFSPGVRESYQLTKGEFFPVSLASESGRVAFVPINRGAEFFDRFVHGTESNVLSPTTWNNYSVGALQCAMRLDVTAVTSSTNRNPSAFRFSYMKAGARQTLAIPLTTGVATGLPPGYIFACNENQTYDFGNTVVDVAYGKNGTYAFQNAVTGSVTYNNARFGDPLVGVVKAGYYKPSFPFEVTSLASGQICVAIYPQRLRAFLTALNADGTAINNSLVVNVDYSTTGINNVAYKPSMPCTDIDYGLVIKECADLTSFSTGFSLVTNLRTYIGDDFNVVAGTPPTGYTPSGSYFPPVSLFAPEKRYGVDTNPYAVTFGGQVGSLASDTEANPIRPLDAKNLSGQTMGADRIRVNLRPIRHPAELPPITMMNWLVVLEERRKEYVGF